MYLNKIWNFLLERTFGQQRAGFHPNHLLDLETYISSHDTSQPVTQCTILQLWGVKDSQIGCSRIQFEEQIGAWSNIGKSNKMMNNIPISTKGYFMILPYVYVVFKVFGIIVTQYDSKIHLRYSQ